MDKIEKRPDAGPQNETNRYTSFQEFCKRFYQASEEHGSDEGKGASFGTEVARQVFRKSD
jgi:hypothetical protein